MALFKNLSGLKAKPQHFFILAIPVIFLYFAFVTRLPILHSCCVYHPSHLSHLSHPDIFKVLPDLRLESFGFYFPELAAG
jgi:hypothetical protein